MSENCPCCSGLQYSLCCEPYLKGDALPASAAELMRSRYTAYVKKNADWLIASWHPSYRTPQLKAALEKSFAHTQWLALTVIATESGSHDNESFVTFFARFLENDQSGAIHERSRFIREDHHWYYIDGTMLQAGRNDRCPCGSGKKYKKCCGQ